MANVGDHAQKNLEHAYLPLTVFALDYLFSRTPVF